MTAGGTIWLTGLPAAGKTTLATAISDALAERGRPVCVLDGDVLRTGLSSDLGMSPEDRNEQARRAAHVAALISRAGIVAVVALVSPYRRARLRARRIHDELGLPFIEVWVDTPLAVCQERDPKGLFALARAGQVQDLTGIDSAYEPPQEPDLRVSGDHGRPAETAEEIIEALLAVQHAWAAPGRES